MLRHTEAVAIETGHTMATTIRNMCRLALEDPEFPPMGYDDVLLESYHGTRFSPEFIQSAQEYRKLHRLVGNRDFLFDAWRRGLAIYFDRHAKNN